MAKPIRVVLVDDHQVARHGLQSFLKACEDLEVVGEAASGEEVLHHIEEAPQLVDVRDLFSHHEKSVT